MITVLVYAEGFLWVFREMLTSPKHGRVWDVVHAVLFTVWYLMNASGNVLDWFFAAFWAVYGVSAWRRWWRHRNDDDDDLPKWRRKMNAAGSRAKRRIVRKLKDLGPSPIPSPV